MKRLSKIAILLLTLIFMFTACAPKNSTDKSNSKADVNASISDSSQAEAEPTPEPDPVVRVMAAGDNLIHTGLYQQAKARATDGTYNFDYAYQYTEPLIKQADLAILNQETLIANDKYEPSSYPCFNSPTQLGDKMIEMGFNAFSHCNNHVLDKDRDKGLIYTLDYWKSRNMLAYGAYRNQEDLDTVHSKTVNGIKFAFVGFTQFTNGISLPKDSECKLVYTSDVAEMERQIKLARQSADVVVVSVHWGVENSNTTNDYQKTLAQQFADWGADLIIGTHPHTIQTMEYLDKPDGSKAFVCYSLGNFISAQSNANLMIGGLIDLNVRKELSTGKIYLEDVKCIPIITQYENGYANIRNYPYNLYSADLATKHGLNAKNIKFDMPYIDKLITQCIPEEFRYLK